MSSHKQEIVEGVVVTKQQTSFVYVEEGRFVPVFGPATYEEPGITDITTHIDQRRRRSLAAIVPRFKMKREEYEDVLALAEVRCWEIVDGDVSARRNFYEDAKMIPRRWGVCTKCYDVVDFNPGCAICEEGGDVRIPRICHDEFHNTKVRENYLIQRNTVVDPHVLDYLSQGSRPLHTHLSVNPGFYDRNRLMNKSQAREFTRRLICLLLFHVEPTLVLDGQRERVFQYMEETHVDQWQTIRDYEKKRCKWDVEHRWDKDRHFYPEFSELSDGREEDED